MVGVRASKERVEASRRGRRDVRSSARERATSRIRAQAAPLQPRPARGRAPHGPDSDSEADEEERGPLSMRMRSGVGAAAASGAGSSAGGAAEQKHSEAELSPASAEAGSDEQPDSGEAGGNHEEEEDDSGEEQRARSYRRFLGRHNPSPKARLIAERREQAKLARRNEARRAAKMLLASEADQGGDAQQ